MSTITTKPRKDPKIQWNDSSYKSWVHLGRDAEEYHGFDFRRSVVKDFMNRIDLNSAPLKQKIGTICRIQAYDYDDEGNQISDKKKQFVYYTIEYSGLDSWRQRINSGEIIEYRHQILPVYNEVKWKLEGNTPVEQLVPVDGEPIIKYHKEFSKQAVYEIIEKHHNEGRRDEIVYTVKFTNNANVQGGGDRTAVSYDQFVNSDFEHCRYLANRLGGPTGDKNLGRIDPNQVQMQCNCASCESARNKPITKSKKKIKKKVSTK